MSKYKVAIADLWTNDRKAVPTGKGYLLRTVENVLQVNLFQWRALWNLSLPDAVKEQVLK